MFKHNHTGDCRIRDICTKSFKAGLLLECISVYIGTSLYSGPLSLLDYESGLVLRSCFDSQAKLFFLGYIPSKLKHLEVSNV